MTLAPLQTDESFELVRGLLGRIPFDEPFVDRLHTETGGLPGAIAGAVLELYDRRLLWRRAGEWRIGQIGDSEWAQLRVGKSRRERDWERLGDIEKDVLTTVALIDEGLDADVVHEVLDDCDQAIATLQSNALISTAERKLFVARDMSRLVFEEVNSVRVKRLRTALIRTPEADLPRTARARLRLAEETTAGAVDEGLWLGSHCLDTGRFTAAITALLQARATATELALHGRAKLASLKAAEAYRHVGRLSEAIALLERDDEWVADAGQEDFAKSRAMVLGSLHKALGDTKAAEVHFAEASRLARKTDPKSWLRAESELAELQWRYGGEPGRNAAVARIHAIEQGSETVRSYPDELASLKYQLGASMVIAGKRDAAIQILREALALATSAYWRMRINNALAAAHFYLGSMRAGIDAADEAWGLAVKGQFDSFKPRILMSRGTLMAGLGKYRESAEQNMLAASWGRKMGSLFDYEAALISAVADFFSLAEYERAIEVARETRSAALRVPNMRDVAKSLEMEGLTLLHIGDYEGALGCLDEARRQLEGRGFDDLMPRLLWHEARASMEMARFDVAEAKLNDALAVLLQTRDYEDLPGVQVEMQVLFSRTSDKRLDLEELRGLLADARARELGTTRLRAAVGFGEVAVSNLEASMTTVNSLMEELRFAETAGADEFVWRIAFWIAKEHRKLGDDRAASSRLASAVRIAREVAAKLTPEHRASYLATPHARLLLTELERFQH